MTSGHEPGVDWLTPDGPTLARDSSGSLIAPGGKVMQRMVPVIACSLISMGYALLAYHYCIVNFLR